MDEKEVEEIAKKQFESLSDHVYAIGFAAGIQHCEECIVALLQGKLNNHSLAELGLIVDEPKQDDQIKKGEK